MKKKPDFAAKLLVESFKRAAMATNFGYLDKDRPMQLAGLRALHRWVTYLEAIYGEEGRLALVPLLDDPDPSIAVFAANYLLKVMPERALPVVQRIENTAPSEVRTTASSVLRRRRHGEID